jgi:glycosyltransferase involved in cell wall biosynthesis
MKILASAYACDPHVGSEPGIGWNWVRQIARRHDCWLITRENNVEAIAERAREEGLDRLHLHGFDLPPWMRFWKRGSRGAVPYFYLWQLGLIPLARRLDREVDFDVVHHLTFASSWIPSGLSFVDKPFVWGPVGQHPPVPERFILESDRKLRLAERGRRLARTLLTRADPFMRHTVDHADCILSLGEEGMRAWRPRHADRIVPMLACGTEVTAPSRDPLLRDPLLRDPLPREHGLRIVFAGRLVDQKGIRLALEAFGRIAKEEPTAEFHVIGKGPRAPWLEQRVQQLGLADRVVRHGHLPHEEALQRMADSDVFLFPSFEGAGMVVVEAMARGCPVVCLDFGGPGEMVDEQRGIRVEARGSFGETVRGLADALRRLRDDEKLRVRLGQGAREWAATRATWEYKGSSLPEIYETAIGHRRTA